MLFEHFENTTWLCERVYRVVPRLLFNNKMGFVDELLRHHAQPLALP